MVSDVTSNKKFMCLRIFKNPKNFLFILKILNSKTFFLLGIFPYYSQFDHDR